MRLEKPIVPNTRVHKTYNQQSTFNYKRITTKCFGQGLPSA